ncbi:hypothetical protein SDRG_09004 [Saprolegnia diclina VS20]|uniref:EF-hand domain-containing protein n=1 Tax=Saprolegnia diclina (strain VS20) TaxID=1156394 RepID=T0QIG0_SAPDV|nr:hypothetical protein SDRG_09004 [Saprolegnia diclina VS20]EQC33495.1 hypothetical protein SDRG_09004 [Saprolegnia diclina VS20]|eukprot:XP_008613135.1 hypothetical protein SDRG_09004 [Saprolegnia diclina VS20]
MAPDRTVTSQFPRTMRKLREPCTVQRISLGCLTAKHPVRRVCIKILQSPWFDRAIILAVCCNTVILGLVDYENAWAEGPNPNMGVNKLIEQWNGVSLYIFVTEMCIKIVAMGFIFGDGAYLLDSWNRLDFIIVLSGMLSVFNIKVGFVRVLRVLRPLRTLHTFPGLKVLTNSLLASLPALGNVAILLAFIYVVFAILGMEIWRGTFHSRCRLTPFPVALPFDALNPPGASAYPVSAAYLAKVVANPAWYRCNKSDGAAYLVDETWNIRANCFWPLDSGLPMPQLCSSSGGRACSVTQTCGSNFDAYGNARFFDIAGPLLNFSIMSEPTFNANLNYGLTNFDNLGNTLMVILQVVTASGWMALTETAQWVGNPALAAIYFNLLLIIGMCFLLQLNMAVLFTEFEKAKDQQAKAAHARAYDPSHGSFIKRLSMVPPPPVSAAQSKRIDSTDIVVASAWRRCLVQWRLRIRQVVLTTAFRRVGIFITLSNVFVMSLNHTEMSYTFAYNCEVLNFTFMIYFGIESLLKMIALELRPFWAYVLTTVRCCANIVFTGIFTCEAILKLNAFGYAYFDDAWNRFDFTIVVFALVSIILPLVTTSVSLGAELTVVRVFRVGRALRLIKKAKLMKNLFDTLTVSLPAVGNVTSLLMLLFYIYSAVGVQLFAKVAFDNQLIHSYQNFQNFFRALQALIGFSTGENWNNFTWEIYYTSPATNPNCDDRTFNDHMCGFNDTDPDCIPLDGCGSWFIVPFMYSMYLIIGYLGMNLFSGIVIDAIGDSSAASPVNPATLAEFADRWAEFDPQGGGLITAEELADFLYTVYPPFGFKSVPGFTRRRVVIAIGELDIPVYDKIYVHFKDVPRALVMRVLAEGSVTKYNEINKLMDQLGINKQFDELWHRRRGKKQKDRLSMREVGRVKEYSATIMIQRFVQRARAKRLRAKIAATEGSSADPEPPCESAAVHGECLMSVDAEAHEAATAIT